MNQVTAILEAAGVCILAIAIVTALFAIGLGIYDTGVCETWTIGDDEQ